MLPRGLSQTYASRAHTAPILTLFTHVTNHPIYVQATKGLAAEYGPHKIRVNTVCPVLCATGLFSMFTGMPDTPENRQGFTSNIPLGRLSETEDIANACLYLGSDEGSFVTGTEMVIDGGKCI